MIGYKCNNSSLWQYHVSQVSVNYLKAGWQYSVWVSVVTSNHRIPVKQFQKCVIKFNSLAHGRFGLNFKIIIFKLISWTDISCTSCKIFVRWIPPSSIGDKSTLVQVMAWCHQATSHYLSQCWPRSLSPYGITRPQWAIFGHGGPCNLCK